MITETECAPVLGKPWCCLVCSSKFKFGEARCSDTVRCPHCASNNIHPIGESRTIDKFYGKIGTIN